MHDLMTLAATRFDTAAMALAFSKEAVIMGTIDYLCLVCESYMRTERDVIQHVLTAGHKTNLDSSQYVDNLRDHGIRKVKKWYFCEFCNQLVSTITKVLLHVKDPAHKANMKMIARGEDGIVCGKILIQEDAWQGFINKKTCVICNTEFENKEDHRADFTHLINLIQCKVITESNNIYRKINDSTFHCLTCNKVVAEITAHFDDNSHEELFVISSKLDEVVEKETGEECQAKESEGLLTKPQRGHLTSDDLDNTDAKFSEETTEQDNDSEVNIKKMAVRNGLTYTSNINKVYCHICYKNVPSTVKNIVEHVNGNLHKTNARLANKPSVNKDEVVKKRATPKSNCSHRKVPARQFVTKMSSVRNLFAEDVLLNDKLCINFLCFLFLRVITREQLFCEVCEVDVSVHSVKDHVFLEEHDRALHERPVVLCSDVEFIREVRPGVFQCGFCNIVKSWEDMEKHLTTSYHTERRIFANWRYQQYMSQLEEQHKAEDMCQEYFTSLLFKEYI